MKIQIEKDESRKDVYTLVVDEEPWKQFHKSIFGAKPKFTSTSLQELESEFVEKELRQSKVFTFKRLAMKAYHTMELIDLLLDRMVSKEAIEEIVIECQNLGYLDDQEHLERMVRAEKSKRSGPRKIIWKVRRKGIQDEGIEREIEKSYPLEEQVKQIKHLLETRFRNRDLSCPSEKSKIFATLSRRGFDFEAIQWCLKAS